MLASLELTPSTPTGLLPPNHNRSSTPWCGSGRAGAGCFCALRGGCEIIAAILGDLPIVGQLFRNNFREKRRTDVTIFLTTRVLQQ